MVIRTTQEVFATPLDDAVRLLVASSIKINVIDISILSTQHNFNIKHLEDPHRSTKGV